MHHPIFPPDTLIALARLNQVHLNGITISHISPVLGLGVLFHSDNYNPECCSLITIDKELILSQESVELAGKSDFLLREVLRACCGILGADPGEDPGVKYEVVGVPCLDLLNEDEDGGDEIHLWGRNPRLMIMLFLAIMLARGRVESEENVRREQGRLSARIGGGGIWSVYGPTQHVMDWSPLTKAYYISNPLDILSSFLASHYLRHGLRRSVLFFEALL